MKRVAALVGGLIFATLHVTAHGQDGVMCETDGVEIVGGKRVEVWPSGGDDTMRVQCAIDQAKAGQIRRVVLAPGQFQISAIRVVEFVGTIEGSGRQRTSLTVPAASIDCAAQRAEGVRSSAIKVVGGDVKLRFMGIHAREACVDQEASLDAIIHITGKPPAESACKDDVVFAAIDRVDLSGAYSAGAGILVSPEADQDGCDRLLGTFKLNRSDVRTASVGVHMTMHGSAQTDINFNEFSDNQAHLLISNANQSTSILGNRFMAELQDGLGHVAIAVVSSGENAPQQNRVAIHGNRFETTLFYRQSSTRAPLSLAKRSPTDVHAIYLGQRPGVALTTSITENRFVMGVEEPAIDIENSPAGVIQSNHFSYSAQGTIVIDGSSGSADGWSILNNDFESDSLSRDIVLGSGIKYTIIGPGQVVQVDDSGENNFVLDGEG